MIMPDWVTLLVALAAGWGLAWILASARAKASVAAAESRSDELRQQLHSVQTECRQIREQLRESEAAKISAETQCKEAAHHLAAQDALLREAKTTLSEAFRSLAAEALASNNTGFLTLAEEKFKALRKESSSDLEQKQSSIEAMLKPLSQLLETYQQETKALEDKRIREISAVGEQLRQVALAEATLQSETAKLVNALRSPQIRGRWGEIALRRTAELAGMSPHCDFVEQHSIGTDGGRLRPDMVVKLPVQREVVVDAKVPFHAFLESLEATKDEDRQRALLRHANQVKQHVNQLSSKEYWEQFNATPEFVVLFIPNDSFLAAAAEQDPYLIERAIQRNVVIATPTTFVALLKAIAYGWKQNQISEDADRIHRLGQELADRMSILADHFSKVGSSLGKAVESYNAAVASLESRILPSARKFRQLGAGSNKDIEELHAVDQTPRKLADSD